MSHKQIVAKINVFVDKDIKNLIEALSAFPKLQTIESCQRIADNRAYICFRYGNPRYEKWKELTRFVFDFLGPKIVNELGDNVDISVRMGSNRDVFAELMVRKRAIKRATNTIQNASKHFS